MTFALGKQLRLFWAGQLQGDWRDYGSSCSCLCQRSWWPSQYGGSRSEAGVRSLCGRESGLCLGTREMTWQLRALAPLAEDSDSIPSTHMAAHNLVQLQLQDFQCALLASAGTACRWTYMWAEHSYIQNKKVFTKIH